ncbi:MAG: hypothetical protein ACJ790_13650 [Myxococcaceae bacterium]
MRRVVLALALVTLGCAIAGCRGAYQCCNNGSYYSCGSKAEADACQTRNDFTDCSRNAEKDNFCRPS